MKLDMNALMKQAQQMQEQMARAQEAAKDEIAEASAGGGMVTARANGAGERGHPGRRGEAAQSDAGSRQPRAAGALALRGEHFHRLRRGPRMHLSRPTPRQADAYLQEDDRAKNEAGARELRRREPLAERECGERDARWRLDRHEH